MVKYPPISFYWHIPFCKRKCDYCHFYVIPEEEASKERLLSAFKKEWEKIAPSIQTFEVVSLYFGGGTPALFGPQRVGQVIDWVFGSLQSSRSIPEITLEINPENVSIDLIRDYKSIGINRMSIGVQSLDDAQLSLLSRQHDSATICRSVDTISRGGIEKISADLMYDIPHQTLENWEMTLNRALSMPVTHYSLYNLTFEPHTVFFKKKKSLQISVPSPDTSLHMYKMACAKFREKGFEQYEISAFGKDGEISIHNTGYWTDRPFIGFGPSAFSYWQHKRFRKIPNLSRYCQSVEMGENPVDFVEEMSASSSRRELLVLHLRLTKGVSLVQIEALYGPFEKETLETIDELRKEGYLNVSEGVVQLSEFGRLFYDTVASALI